MVIFTCLSNHLHRLSHQHHPFHPPSDLFAMYLKRLSHHSPTDDTYHPVSRPHYSYIPSVAPVGNNNPTTTGTGGTVTSAQFARSHATPASASSSSTSSSTSSTASSAVGGVGAGTTGLARHPPQHNHHRHHSHHNNTTTSHLAGYGGASEM